MQNYPLVTIITPCYNGEVFLDQYFESVLAQTYPNLELIFVNDGSTDRTEKIALSYREKLEARGIIYKYLYKPNGGQASAMNVGLKEMTGEYLVWPDSDDVITPDSIEKRVAFLINNPDYVWVRSNVKAIDYDTGKYLFHFAQEVDKGNKDIFMDLILERTYCCCCYMVKVCALRTIYQDLKIMESKQGQNWQILIPIAAKYPCAYLNDDLYIYSVRNNSHSREKRTLEQEVARRMGLKEILLDSIKRSGRTDRDYDEIVHYKYQNILLCVYTEYGARKSAKKCYRELLQAKKLEPHARSIYTKHFNPFKWHLIQFGNLLRRIYGKLSRIIQSRKK